MGNSEIKENILFQLDMCWQLYLYHTENLQEEEALWSGSIEKAKTTIKLLRDKWILKLNDLSDTDYKSKQYSKWPLEDRNFADIALWLNGELMKNAAEIGYGRFLYATCIKQGY